MADADDDFGGAEGGLPYPLHAPIPLAVVANHGHCPWTLLHGPTCERVVVWVIGGVGDALFQTIDTHTHTPLATHNLTH